MQSKYIPTVFTVMFLVFLGYFILSSIDSWSQFSTVMTKVDSDKADIVKRIEVVERRLDSLIKSLDNGADIVDNGDVVRGERPQLVYGKIIKSLKRMTKHEKSMEM